MQLSVVVWVHFELTNKCIFYGQTTFMPLESYFQVVGPSLVCLVV